MKMRACHSRWSSYSSVLRLALGALTLGLCLAARQSDAALTRAQAVAALFSPGSGVSLDTNHANVWSPYLNFGFGPGNEGLLPVGSLVQAGQPGLSILISSPSYFFFVDDARTADFAHPVRFVVLDANNPAPVLGSGILLTNQHWWPVITPFGGSPADYFHTAAQVETAFPPSPTNPQGLIAGKTLPPGGLGVLGPLPKPGPSLMRNEKACGIVLFGSSDKPTFKNAADLMQSDLVNHYGVPAGRIVRAGGANAATSADLANAISQVCTSQPPCDKIFVRMASHGDNNPPGFKLADGYIAATNLCKMFKNLADKGVPICTLINACYSGSLLDAHNWNFPAGSVIITAASATNYTFSWSYQEGAGSFTNVAFYYAFSKCLNANPTNNPGLDGNGDGFVDDQEAYRWVLSQQPCYTPTDATNEMDYPAGRGTNYNPGPQIATVGTSPSSINLNVCNGTGSNKLDFHLVFRGNVTNGTPISWLSDSADHLGGIWAAGQNGTSVTYVPATDTTTVSWGNPASPVAPNQYIHFGYAPEGGGLRPVKQYWTPTTNPDVAVPERVPAKQISILPTTNSSIFVARLVTSGIPDDGWAVPESAMVQIRYSATNIPLNNLSLADPIVNGLPFVYGTYLSLQPDIPVTFAITLPFVPTNPSPTLVVQTREQWSLNNNIPTTLDQIYLPLAPVVIPPFSLNIALQGSFAVLTWSAPGVVLESSPSLFGPWTAMPTATSPHFQDTAITPGPRYFRLHYQGQ